MYKKMFNTWSLNLLEESSSMKTGDGIFRFRLKLGILGIVARSPRPMPTPYPPSSSPISRDSMIHFIESTASSFLLEISWKYYNDNIEKKIIWFPNCIIIV